MMFSILIPVYNVEKYLIDCLQSIINQEFKDYEIVLIDDGSTDGSSSICDTYEKQYNNIRVIHQKNHGLLYTRRVGFKEAVGDYCLVVDSDDFVSDSILLTLSQAITQFKPDMIIINALKYYNGKTYQHKLPMYSDNKLFLGEEINELYIKLLNREMSNTLWTKIVKRSIVDVENDYSFYQDVSMGEDLLQSLPLLTNAESVLYIKEPLYYYRTNLASLTQKYNPQSYCALVKVNKKMDEYVHLWKINNGEIMAANRFMIDVYDVFVSLVRIRDKAVFKKGINELYCDKYFREKYRVASIRLLDIRKRFIIWSLYRKSKTGMALAKGMVLFAEWYKFRRISGGKI